MKARSKFRLSAIGLIAIVPSLCVLVIWASNSGPTTGGARGAVIAAGLAGAGLTVSYVNALRRMPRSEPVHPEIEMRCEIVPNGTGPAVPATGTVTSHSWLGAVQSNDAQDWLPVVDVESLSIGEFQAS